MDEWQYVTFFWLVKHAQTNTNLSTGAGAALQRQPPGARSAASPLSETDSRGPPSRRGDRGKRGEGEEQVEMNKERRGREERSKQITARSGVVIVIKA